MRTGVEYLEALDDDRHVYLDGERVQNVADHPAFAGAARTIAGLFELAADPATGMRTDAGSGTGPNRAMLTPRSREDLEVRRAAITTWARHSQGFIGRGPDHVANFFAGFASAAHLFDREAREFGAHVLSFYQQILAEDLYLSYTILPPQVDRSTTASGWEDEFVQVGVVDEAEGGIIVRGAQALGTGAALADWLFVSCIKPLGPDDAQYANSFVVPISASGLRLICRRPYATSQPSGFDYPLSTRFDESDALVIFDDVFVPWEQVFVYRDPEMLRHQFYTTPAHVLGNSQAQIRLIVKLQFILGVARKIAATNGVDRLPPVQEKLGELAALVATVEGMTLAAEATAQVNRDGVAVPNPRFVYSAMALQPEVYPRIIQTIRDLSGVGVLQLPASYRDMLSPSTRADISRVIQSPGVSAEERVKLFKLAWDFLGSEFAGRHQQYEMFYGGAPFVVRGYAYRNYGFEEPVKRVDEFLASYKLDDSGSTLASSPSTNGAPTMSDTTPTPLNEALAKQRDAAPPGVVPTLRSAAQEVEESRVAPGLDIGDVAPDFTLPDATGQPVALSKRLSRGPVVVSFYRGAWCPYCNIELRALQAALPRIRDAGATLIAISPQQPDDALGVKEKHALEFDVLSDVDQSVIRAYRVQFRLPDAIEDLHLNVFKKDLTELNADGSWNLPVPATFVLSEDGTVRDRYVGADYTQRLEPDDIVAALESLSGARVG